MSQNTSRAPVAIAIIGAGLIGTRHAQAIISSPNATLCALVDPRPADATLASSLNAPCFPSVTALLAADPIHRPSGAIICTPNDTHVTLSQELIAAGVHVLVEKPISTDVASGAALVVAAREAGIKLCVGHHRRFNAYLLAAKAIMDSGSLGTIVAVNGLWMTCKPAEYFAPPNEWRSGAGGGVVLINLVHEVDLLMHMLGPIVRVFAERTQAQRGVNDEEAVEEGAAITLRFASGVVGTFLVCDVVPSAHNFEAGTGENPAIPLQGEGADFYRIFGTRASLSVPDLVRSSYDGRKARSWTETLMQERVEVGRIVPPFELQMEHFVRVVRGEEEPVCSGTDGLRAMVVCDAVKRSLRTGVPVDVTGVSSQEARLLPLQRE